MLNQWIFLDKADDEPLQFAVTEVGPKWIAPHHAAAMNTNIYFVLMWWFGLGSDVWELMIL